MDQLFDDLSVPFERDVPLGPMTWYDVGGPARYVAHPSSVQQLSALASKCHGAGIPMYVMGSGANLLVRDEGVDGVVVRLDDPAFKFARIDGATVVAGSGADLRRLVIDTARLGLSGFECMAGIPATVGGAVRMNAGGGFGDIGRVVNRVSLMESTGQVYQRDREDLIFSYRRSNISAPFILEVEFKLETGDPEAIRREVKRVFFHKKNSQPLAASSAGCAFKNPPAESADGLSAGALIDRAGLKQFRLGGAEVSDRHANFIVTHDGCTAEDVFQVMEHVRRTVAEKFNVELEREVVVWP